MPTITLNTPKPMTNNAPIAINKIDFLVIWTPLTSSVMPGNEPIKKPANKHISTNIKCSNAHENKTIQTHTAIIIPSMIGINTLIAQPNFFLKLLTAPIISSYTRKITAIAAPLTPGIAAPAPIAIPATSFLNHSLIFIQLLSYKFL